MPIYEYECEKCKRRFEILQKMSDPPLTECSDCKGKVHKLVSSPSGLLFKGSGWYVTDYARKGKSEKSDAKAEGGSNKTKEPSKPEGAPKPSSSPSSSKE